MLITIYDSIGNPKVDLSPNDSSTQVKEVQGDSVLTLSFTHYEHIELDVDDYADFLGERFWLTEKYRPKQNSRMEWVYDLKLYGVESMIKRLLVIKTVDGEENPVFTLTAPPREHVAIIVKCMNDGMGNISDWKVGQVNGTENIVIDYFGKYCDEALKEIAEKVGTEWWADGQTVNICKCEYGEPVELGYNKGLLSIDPGTADNVKFYTRLYPVGSSRNIDREKYGFTRLQLPGGQKYVEINADKYGRVDHFEQSAFEGIYPRRVGSVSNVRSEVKTGEDGNPFTIYYFTDNSLPFDPNDYMIGGLVIRVSFQEGSELAGLGEEEDGTYFFEVNFNSTTREFEIITIWPYDNDIQLPGDKLVPKVGDKYILWNLRMPDEYYALAEEEFLTAVNKYNADHNLDISVYKAPTDHVWIEDNAVELTIGRRVRLESEEYFPGFGFRDSRITKITRKVNLPSSMDIEISDALSRTSQEKLADSIADVRSFAESIAGATSLPDIIRTGDRTKPTDNNLFSAKRIQDNFMDKTKDDRSEGTVASDKGFEVGEFVSGISGAAVRKRADGLTEAEVDMLYVRVKALFETLTAVRTESLAGEQLVTPAGSLKCREVEDMGDSWRCYFLAEQDGERIDNTFAVGDQARCSYFNASTASGNRISNKFYWRLVIGVGADYIDISKSDCADGSDIPEAGDVICQLGNRTDSTRQSAVRISTVLGNPPSVCLLNGIDSYDLTGCDVVSLGVDSATGRPFMRCYGDMTLGDRTGAKSFLSYDSLTGIMDYKGRLNLLSTVGDDTLGGYIAKQIGGNMLRLDLSNEMEGVACDADGNPVGRMPSTEATVYKGGSADTGWTFSKTDSGCVSAFLTGSIIEVASLSPAVNTATVTVTATKPGHTPLTAVMSIYKVIPGKSGSDGADGENGADGADGKPATVFSLLPSVSSVTRHADGSLSASAVTCTVLKTTGDSAPLASNEHTLSYQRLPDGSTGTLTRNNGVSQPVQIIPGTESIVFELKSGNTVLDRERVPVLSDVEGFGEGGENLILNAGFTSFENWDTPRKDMVIDAGNRFNGSNVAKIKTEGYESNMWRGFWQRYPDNPNFGCEPDTYYSFSIWAYTPDRATLDGARFDIYVYDSNGVRLTSKSTDITLTANEAWQQFKGTFKTPATAHHLSIEFWSLRNGEVWFSKPQLVRGAFLPDWAPSPYDFDYVTEALRNSGSFEAGLLLASLIKLGYTDEHGDYNVMAGLNGIAKDTTGRDIAFWGGGDMIDADNGDDIEGAATAAIRFDGTAYFARNVIRLLKEAMCIGPDVLLDKEGIKLMVDGDVRAIVSNRPVDVDFGRLASNVRQFGQRTQADLVSVPMAQLGTFRMAVYQTVTKSYDLGTVTEGSTGSCNIDVTALHSFTYGHPTKGIWPISSLARAELRRGADVIATFSLSTFSSVRYNGDLLGNKTDGSIAYEIHESISFTCPTAGAYSLVIVFPQSESEMDGSTAGSLDCSVRVFGTVKLGLGNLTTIGSDGFASIWGESAVAVNSSAAAIRSGLYGMVLDTAKGLRATLNGGQTWFTLKQSGGQLIFTT